MYLQQQDLRVSSRIFKNKRKTKNENEERFLFGNTPGGRRTDDEAPVIFL